MQTHRCPECGNRLQANYCDICMRRVPFAGLRSKTAQDPWEDSSAHRQEKGHKCVTFDTPKPVLPKPKAARKTGKKKPGLALILAAVSLIGFFGDLWGDFREEAPVAMPEYNTEAFVYETDLPAVKNAVLDVAGEIFITADALGLYYDEPALSLLIDNKSNRDIDVTVEQVAVNGCMIDAGMSLEVPAGESGQGILCLYRQDLEKAGIDQILGIDLRLRGYDREDYTELFYKDTWTLVTEATGTHTYDRSGWEIIQEPGLSVRLRQAEFPDANDCRLTLYLENTGTDAVYFYTTAVTANGQSKDTWFVTTLLPGTCAVEDLLLEDLELEDPSQFTELYLAYTVEYLADTELLDMVEGFILLNPNDLPEAE